MAIMLSAATSAERKTHIMYKANLNYAVVKECLESLIAAGLIEEAQSGGAAVYKTTPKGMDFLSDFKALKAHLSEVG